MKDSKEFKTEKLVEYFTDKKRIDITDKNYEAAIKLDKMIYLYNQEIDTLNKYYQMTLIFKKAIDFSKEYKFLKEFLDNSSVYYLDLYIEEICFFLNKIERSLSKESLRDYLTLEKNKYFDDYCYAEYFVKQYIDYNESPFIRDFLIDSGINEQDFLRFTNIVFELNEDLYNKYLEKSKSNQIIRKSETIRKIDNIKEGIVSGYTKDGNKFDGVEFFANLPFDDMDKARETIEDFELKKLPSIDKRLRTILERLCPENVRDIMNYVYSNNLLNANPSKISEKDIMNITYINNDLPLSNEGKLEIIDYMKERNIPFFQKAFNVVKDKYLNEGLEINKATTLKK